METTIDVIIPVFRPNDELLSLLWMLKKQTVPVRKIIVMITRSEDAVYPDFSSFGNVETSFLLPEEFDHGGTRDRGISFSDADFVLLMTQDAEPLNNYLTENLLKPFEDPGVAVSYARQLPKKDCRVIERYTRKFNYPAASGVKSVEDLPDLGIKTYFCSNVCAMYRRSVYMELGGFTKKTIFNEDMIFASKAVNAGYKIAYAADAEVLHSHNFTGIQQFHRNFDLAVSQADHPEIFAGISSESEGKKLVKDTAKYLLKSGRFFLVPVLIYQSGMKYIGYRLGKNYRKHSLKFNRFCSMNKKYWREENGTD